MLNELIAEIEREKAEYAVQGGHGVYVGLGLAEEIIKRYLGRSAGMPGAGEGDGR